MTLAALTALPATADSNQRVLERQTRERQIVEQQIVSTPRAGRGSDDGEATGEAQAASLEANVDGIELIATMTEGNRSFDLYQNKNRTCGRSGFHTFAVASDLGVDDSEPRPLWIRLLGSATGWFAEDGSYPTGGIERLDEWRDRLLDALAEDGLMAIIDRDEAGFRFVVPGMCDHDMHSGEGQLDPHNPFQPDDNDRARRVDGLRAVRDAIAFVEMTYATEQKFVQGTSSGAIGTTSLAISYGNSANGLDGIIVDTGSFNPFFAQLVDVGCTEFGNLDVRDAADRLNWTMVRGGDIIQSAQMPHLAIEQGILDLPIYEVWSRNDHSVCGEQVVTLRMEDGTPVTGQGQELLHMRMRDAIETFNPGGNSVSKVVCADRPVGLVAGMPGFRRCGLHGITKWAASTVGGDRDRGGEDYNEDVYAWILSILPPRADPPPVGGRSGSGALGPIAAAVAILLAGTSRRRRRR